MKAQITITGQVGGNTILYNKLGGDGMINKMKGTFNSVIVFYKTKTHAQKALSVAYQSIIAEEPGIKNKIGGVIYGRGNFLAYDASTAIIYESIK